MAVRNALGLVRRALPNEVEPTTWSTWERLSAHAVSAAAELAARGFYSEDFLPVMADVAWFSSRRGFPHYANYLYLQAISYVTAHVDQAKWDDRVFVMEELAHSFLELRAADRAVPLFRLLIELAERHGRLGSPGTIVTRVGLASALTDTGNHSEALEQLELAAEDFDGLTQPDPSLGCRLYGTWGRLLVRTGAPDEGRNRLKRALILSEEAGNGADIALTHLHLGNSYRAAPGSTQAREHYERALDVLMSVPSSYQIQAEVLVNLSAVEFERGDAALALQHTENALRDLNEVPEGPYSVTAAMLRYQRAQFRSRIGGATVMEVVDDASIAFNIACDHLPLGHPHRLQVGAFLLHLAAALDDDTVRSAVLAQEPALQPGP